MVNDRLKADRLKNALEAQMETIARQEAELTFPTFDENTAWRFGNALRAKAEETHAPLVIDIRFFHRPLFYAALPGSAPENEAWARRKRNVVAYTSHSSYFIGRKLALQNATLSGRYGLAPADYAAHGGSFPLTLQGSGVMGALTVSGLAQRDDHMTIVHALCDFLGKDPQSLALPPE